MSIVDTITQTASRIVRWLENPRNTRDPLTAHDLTMQLSLNAIERVMARAEARNWPISEAMFDQARLEGRLSLTGNKLMVRVPDIWLGDPVGTWNELVAWVEDTYSAIGFSNRHPHPRPQHSLWLVGPVARRYTDQASFGWRDMTIDFGGGIVDNRLERMIHSMPAGFELLSFAALNPVLTLALEDDVLPPLPMAGIECRVPGVEETCSPVLSNASGVLKVRFNKRSLHLDKAAHIVSLEPRQAQTVVFTGD